MVVFSKQSANLQKLSKEELKYLLDQLKNIRGRHTELVTIYVPAGYNINDIKELVAKEISTAENIKSKTTRKNVIDALSKIANELKYFTQTPEKGMVIFSGNVSEKEGQSDIKIWEIEPPEPIGIKLYRCDQKFITDILEQTLETKEVYGLISLDRQEAAIGFLRGKHIEVAKRIESMVPGKTAKGGQSAARFMRVREGLLNAYLKEVGESAKSIFEGEKNLIGILVGGPGPLKQEFVEGDYLPEALKKKVLGLVDTGYSGEPGLKELVERAEDILKESSYLQEKRILDEFFATLRKSEAYVAYGLRDVMRALEAGAADKILISEDNEFKALKIKCNACGAESYKYGRANEDLDVKTCPVCGSDNIEKEPLPFIKFLKEEAEKYGTEVIVVSSESPEGQQFKMFASIGAFLRYKLD